MQFYFDIFLAVAALIALLVIIKTVSFFSGDYSASFADWLYFSKYSIYGSRDELIVKAKKRQNSLSVTIMILGILALALLWMWHIS
jgi:hypothetical protein